MCCEQLICRVTAEVHEHLTFSACTLELFLCAQWPQCVVLPFPLQAALSRLASDLSSMVNNPQLSDMQLQVDSGEVYFAHSFMVYARCPLLAEMVKELRIKAYDSSDLFQWLVLK